MNSISIANDIIPVGKFKTDLAKYLTEINTKRNSLIITQNGKPAGVLISPSEFDRLNYTNDFLSSLSEGLKDSEKGYVLSTSQLRNVLTKARAGRDK
ncbi:MAG: type II toxin-antitoxin system Phd/YefM family antitoxin [Melioribacteraceae bacterium]|nr:type II toxin-antitoxin system Phd/YefM family antitoxin [Melioribacteraceae bacterium]